MYLQIFASQKIKYKLVTGVQLSVTNNGMGLHNCMEIDASIIPCSSACSSDCTAIFFLVETARIMQKLLHRQVKNKYQNKCTYN